MDLALMMVATFATAQTAVRDFHQDFRDSQPLSPSLKLVGPKAETRIKSEDAGLRITPPTTGGQTKGWGVASKFRIAGDFQITARYELVTLDPPQKGKWAGVSLSVAPTGERLKFAKVGRFCRDGLGNVYVAETFAKDKPDAYRLATPPTEARTGKLRLERKGTMLYYLVSDEPGDQFRQLMSTDYGIEDVEEIFFIANNNTSPTAVDARLLSLAIKCEGRAAQAKDGPRAIVETGIETPVDAPAGRRRWLVIGVVLVLVMVAFPFGWKWYSRLPRKPNPVR